MKKTVFIFLLNVLQMAGIVNGFSQSQPIEFNYKEGQMKYQGWSPSMMDRAKYVNNKGVSISISGLDLSKLNSISFIDNNNVSIGRYTQKEEFKSLLQKDGKLLIVISPNNRIGNYKTPYLFPYRIEVKYDSVIYSSGSIGTATAPLPTNNSTTTVTKNNSSSPPPTPVIPAPGKKDTPKQQAPPPPTLKKNTDEIKYTGICYYDAISIRKLINTGQNSRLYIFMSNYFNGNNIRIKSQLLDSVKEDSNIFLQMAFKNINGLKDASAAAESGIASSPVASIGGLNVTNIADGIAEFLIKRGKEELNIAFFTKMKTYLDTHPECTTLFPATTKFLDNIETSQYSELMQSLREAFNSDMKNLMVDVPQVMDLPKYQDLMKKLPEIRIAMRTAKIVSDLSQSKKPYRTDSIIHLLAQVKDINGINPNLSNAWRLLDAISQSLRDTEKGYVWISYNEFSSNIINNDTLLNIYLGLLYERSRGITFTNNAGAKSSVKAFMLEHGSDINTISDLEENFLTLANSVEKTMDEYNASKSGKTAVSNDEVYTYLNEAIDVLQYGFKVANTIQPGVANDGYILIAEDGLDLYKNVTTKNYNAGVKDVYNIIAEVDSVSNTYSTFSINLMNLTKDVPKIEKQIADVKSQLAKLGTSDNLKVKTITAQLQQLVGLDNQEKSQIITLTNLRSGMKDLSSGEKDTLKCLTKMASSILKYGNLMAGIINAKSPDEVESAIESAALPAGSYSIKRNSCFNWAINGYIGGGNDFGNPGGASSEVINARNNYKVNWNLYAPIGFSLSLGSATITPERLWRKKVRNRSSLTLFIPLVDIGAIANYRLVSNDSVLNMKITLANIFSPGATIIYGIPTLPLAISAGILYKPSLIYSKEGGAIETVPTMWRYNVSLLIDIPISNIMSVNRGGQ